MTLEVVLFDLDDTLLANDMDVFLPAYFELLGKYVAGRFEPRHLVAALRSATGVMMTSPGVRNSDAFWSHFAPQLGATRDELEGYFEVFYAREFSKLRECTQRVNGAAEVVAWFAASRARLVLATNPVFPRSAILQRLEWSGLAPETFDLVTSYENMHATKPDLAYYREILSQMNVAPEQALMVGNDWDNDIAPAKALGLRTYHVVAGVGDGGVNSGTLQQWCDKLRERA